MLSEKEKENKKRMRIIYFLSFSFLTTLLTHWLWYGFNSAVDDLILYQVWEILPNFLIINRAIGHC